MHIAEGVLSAPVLITGAVITAGATAIGLKKTDNENIPATALLCCVFFVTSLIHVPIGPSSAHFIMNGLLGILLGWSAFPAILVALVLQAVFFGFGGITSLGVNTMIMALPAVIVYYTLAQFTRAKYGTGIFVAGFAAGILSIGLSSLLAAAALLLSGREFLLAAKLIIISHIPIMIVEGIVTGSTIIFLKKVKPEMLAYSRGRLVCKKQTYV